ncbi:TetR/AcrR family transcriptional regulator [Mycobacterium sp. CBMA271]|uniref:TetR/AcrR family transcriptional regulator n=1 Tax=unclassified Mycobacteroides TaxID=2618759 RepID=UPI0012DF276F|nr:MULTISPECIES: TetR/AcrR family transcriptional regulator [unclassified Mycobacteroides]MUM17735.1 TetR family transcriptional regulator [Mycobacteroides sp. CBMA 326]MUM22990.1 TetR/AcrR family transcriptional regulator [Mycobacteroides sp. CBMA 271]
MVETSTKDRLIVEAMRLFGEQGYKATSVAQIEKAAGLTPGSGGLYHHFKSKEALLDAGIDRQLDRRRAMQDIRSLFVGLGDLRNELTMLGRYVLVVLDEESQLFQLASSVPAGRPERLTNALAALFDSMYGELSEWIRGWAPDVPAAEAKAIAVVGINALMGKRVANGLLASSGVAIADEDFVAEWTSTLAVRIESLR